MAYKFFVVPIRGDDAAEKELNGFLKNHTVLAVDRRWVDQGSNSFWSFCIDYLEPGSGGARDTGSARKTGRIDYRELLNDEEFVLFAKLRDLRKEVAQAEGIPVYSVFNNDQLAQMVQKRARTKGDLEAIVGVGEARIEKYASRFLEFLGQQVTIGDETNDKSV